MSDIAAINQYILEQVKSGNMKEDMAFTLLKSINTSQDSVDDIAIIGVSCRFPQADNVEEFWNNISMGKDCICSISDERKEQLKYNQRACICDRGACNRCGSSTYSWRYF